MKLIDKRTEDGSRHFVSLPNGATLGDLREHLVYLGGVEVREFVSRRVEEPWFEFTYRGNRFAIRRRGDQYHFFVRNPLCSDVELYQLASYCEQLLTSVDCGAANNAGPSLESN